HHFITNCGHSGFTIHSFTLLFGFIISAVTCSCIGKDADEACSRASAHGFWKIVIHCIVPFIVDLDKMIPSKSSSSCFDAFSCIMLAVQLAISICTVYCYSNKQKPHRNF
uniref:Uncharacterized protein n=1 Tax=Amphimedon queenslandica TaxID=400682 RepID=A0A1X7UAK6_AMPQE